jgi:hypothetical protein
MGRDFFEFQQYNFHGMPRPATGVLRQNAIGFYIYNFPAAHDSLGPIRS